MEVLPEHLNAAIEVNEHGETVSTLSEQDISELSIEEQIENRFKCAACGGQECDIQEVAMSGPGLSKILDIDYKHYLYVSCMTCGIVVVYNPDILRGHKSGVLSTGLDILFGR
ncbi:zinc ribbon domain-containing protein [Paenibacillus dakarensis]|uniref:zinc ribbon domain-containing protein n=1 Tax=Paenibacillus dakarensis TaxID=1527293 RepID=UPI001FDF419F|nr:zinc ribbon domain-containing protein [Paenibacillus dakarensis]